MENESLSSIFGWVSIACWVVVYSPQIVENKRRQSAEGLSVFFILTWLLGDVCNLIGAILAHLLPTVIVLALYYSICDIILLAQIYYYRWKNPRMLDNERVPVTEDTPLIQEVHEVPLEGRKTSIGREFIKHAIALLFVFATGIAVWAIDRRIYERKGVERTKPEEVLEWKSQILGWMSAVLFLGARIPQILKNFETKCEGLAPALFVFSISGNLTYGLSICFASMEPRWLLANAAWLAGSVLTVFLDLFVLGQFLYFYNTVNVAHNL